jgi:hypothetical protein
MQYINEQVSLGSHRPTYEANNSRNTKEWGSGRQEENAERKNAKKVKTENVRSCYGLFLGPLRLCRTDTKLPVVQPVSYSLD